MSLRRLFLFIAMLLPLYAAAADDFLDPEMAFRFGVSALDASSLEVRFDIAPGYYMHRERLQFSAEGATLGAPELPQGKVKFDATFQKDVETYRDVLRIRVPVTQAGA